MSAGVVSVVMSADGAGCSLFKTNPAAACEYGTIHIGYYDVQNIVRKDDSV